MSLTKTKLVAFGDTDTTKDAENVLTAVMKETDVSQYLFLGDGPYSKTGTKWASMMSKYFDETKKQMLMITRGNHDEDESESKQTQKDMEAWIPSVKGIGFEDTWLSAKQVGNTYIIDMDTQDLDVEFKRDQYKFVESELTKAKDLRAQGKIDWIIVLFHKPFFTLKSSHSPYTAVRFLYKDLFRDAQVDFCLSGHNHNTQLWLPMVPSDSEANGEGQQLFTLAADGKTFDFSKDHGQLYIVQGISGHEFNKINDSGSGVKNVMFYRDNAFGYTTLEIEGKKVKVLSKTVDGKIDYEYNVTREGTTTPPPPEPEPCGPSECKDPQTGKCRDMASDETVDNNGFCKKIVVEPPPQPEGVVCPRNYEFDPSLGHCIPMLEQPIGPECPQGYKWNPTTKVCDKDDTQPPPVEEPCKDNECKDPTTNQCRQIGTDEIKDAQGFCRPKPLVTCPDGQCKDTQTGQCRAIAADEIKDENGFCKKKDIPPPPPVDGKVIYDSNVNGKWNDGKKRTIKEGEGSQDPDGKGLHTAASGDPELTVDGDGVAHLESSKWGRIYIYVKQYNVRLEGQFKFETDHGEEDNISIKMRSRHGNNNHPQGGSNKFGGVGFAFHPSGECSIKAEIEHSGDSFQFGTLKGPKLGINEWHKFTIDVFDENNGITASVKVDDKDIGTKKWANPHKTAIDKAAFAEDSYFWIRNNCHDGKRAKIGIKDLKLYNLDNN